MSRIHVLATTLLAAAAVVVMAACGGSGSTAGHPSSPGSPTRTLGQEFPAMKAAVRAATSVAISGTVMMHGQRESLDIILTKSGSLSGSVSVGGRMFTILVTGGKPYIKISKAFLQEAHLPVGVCATVCGKYVELPPSSAKTLTSGLNITAMANQAFTAPTAAQASVRLVPAQYRGQPAWFGRYRSYTVYIARTGKPYVLGMTAKNGQVLRFSGWNTATVPGPPPASQLVTPTQL
jgi:hypothetical protein